MAHRLATKVVTAPESPSPTPLAVRASGVPSRDFTKLEKNLSALGFFTPSSKRIKSVKAKTITFSRVVSGKRVEGKATIVPGALYGLPITTDQDKYLALQKIICDILNERGVVENPIAFTSAQLLRVLRQQKSGRSYKEIAEWLDIMFSTSIISEGVVFFADKKQFVTDRFRVFDRAVSAGTEIEPGVVADMNLVWLSTWQLENINSKFLLPVDLETYRELKNHIAKALVPHLQIWLFASEARRVCEKRYDELCQLLNIRLYRPISRIREQLGPSLDELKGHGYIAKWGIEKTSDRKSHKIVFVHGAKYYADRRLRQGGADEEPVLDPSSPTAEPAALSDPTDPPLLGELVRRGITRRIAAELLSNLAADQPLMDQIEYADAQIVVKQERGEDVRNTAGFYVSLIRDNVPVPDTFETSRKRREREAAGDERRRQEQIQTARQRAYNEYREGEIDQVLAAMAPEELDALMSAKKEQLLTLLPKAVNWPADQVATWCIRHVRAELGKKIPLGFDEFFAQQGLAAAPEATAVVSADDQERYDAAAEIAAGFHPSTVADDPRPSGEDARRATGEDAGGETGGHK